MNQMPPPNLVALMKQDFAPQRPFSYPREAWRSWLKGIPEAVKTIDSLPEALDRQIVTEVFETLWPDNVPGAFVAAMIWGHGSSNYGPYRTAKVLTQSARPKSEPIDSSVTARLRTSVELVRSNGPGDAYEYLNNSPGRIKGLGPAFFTKWLYFGSAKGPAGNAGAAPILDALISNWFAELEPPVRLRYARTPDYRQYVELLAEWGQPYGIGPAGVEERIFRLIRDDGLDTPNSESDDDS